MESWHGKGQRALPASAKRRKEINMMNHLSINWSEENLGKKAIAFAFTHDETQNELHTDVTLTGDDVALYHCRTSMNMDNGQMKDEEIRKTQVAVIMDSILELPSMPDDMGIDPDIVEMAASLGGAMKALGRGNGLWDNEGGMEEGVSSCMMGEDTDNQGEGDQQRPELPEIHVVLGKDIHWDMRLSHANGVWQLEAVVERWSPELSIQQFQYSLGQGNEPDRLDAVAAHMTEDLCWALSDPGGLVDGHDAGDLNWNCVSGMVGVIRNWVAGWLEAHEEVR